jgi:nicotinamide mononucleotide (NMN) deamidase PncC
VDVILEEKKALSIVETTSGGGLSFALTDQVNCMDWFKSARVFPDNQMLFNELKVELGANDIIDKKVLKNLIDKLFAQNPSQLLMMNLGGSYNPQEQLDSGVILVWAQQGSMPVISACSFSGSYDEVRKEIILQSLQGLINFLQENL